MFSLIARMKINWYEKYITVYIHITNSVFLLMTKGTLKDSLGVQNHQVQNDAVDKKKDNKNPCFIHPRRSSLKMLKHQIPWHNN